MPSSFRMRRHFHGPRSGHSDRGCVGAVPISHGPTEVSFSAAFCAAVHPGVIVGLKAKGFTCDVDLRYLTVEELTSGMQGFLDEEEAASLIELSQVTVRSMPNRSSSGIVSPRAHLTTRQEHHHPHFFLSRRLQSARPLPNVVVCLRLHRLIFFGIFISGSAFAGCFGLRLLPVTQMLPEWALSAGFRILSLRA